MFCPYCGKEIPDDSTFCEICGSKIDAEPAADSPAPEAPANNTPVYEAPAPEASDNNKTSPILIGVAAIAVLAVIVGIFVARGEKGDEGNEANLAQTPDNVVTTQTTDNTVAAQTADNTVATQTADNTLATQAADNTISDQTAGKTDSGSSAEKEDYWWEDDQYERDTSMDDFLQGLMDEQAANDGSFSGPNITGVNENVVIEDFDWYRENGFPVDAASHNEIWGLGGLWKCMLDVNADSQDQGRIMISDTDVQYMGYKLTLLFHVKGRYEYPLSSPGDMKYLGASEDVTITMVGDWDEERASMDVCSETSDLNCKINMFREKDGFEYAYGTVLNGDEEIGQVIMVRKKP